jgi:hypothetical protein
MVFNNARMAFWTLWFSERIPGERDWIKNLRGDEKVAQLSGGEYEPRWLDVKQQQWTKARLKPGTRGACVVGAELPIDP